MDFIDRIQAISQKARQQSSDIKNEQATKTAFIMPFIQSLGYDVFNPMEVAPEFTADLPGLKGKKVDYAIMQDNKPIILIECKCCGDSLEHPKHSSQLHSYFHVTEAKFGVLTNGIIYRFYTDTEKSNIMDIKPFFEFSILNFDESSMNELKRFSKSNFNSNELEDVAKNLLYTKEIKRLLAEQINNPSSDFIKFFASQVYAGRITSTITDKFTEIIKRSLKEFINDRITERLVSAINVEDVIVSSIESEADDLPNVEIITTEEELEAFYVVKSILREIVDTTRIQHKDTRSYFGINIDGKVTKTVCRLQLSEQKKSISIVNAEGKEAKMSISSLDEVYGLSAILKDRVKYLIEDNRISADSQL